MIELGFEREVERQLHAGSTYLFPLLQHHQSKCTAAFSKWVNRHISKRGVDDPKVFQSFRHTFKDACREAEIPGRVQEALLGHASGQVGERYGAWFFTQAPCMRKSRR